ncbi:MAG: DUF4832 domain-containing protein [Thermoguttaceae bacterium]|jgi:hypothetical protein
MFQRIVRFAAICGLLAYGATVLAEEQVVTPQETDEILANPGMGWETFGRTSKQDKNLPSWIPSTVRYNRWGWGELEPQPGKLNTEFLDKVLKETHDSGQKLAFRVMCCSTYKGRPYHPKWLKDLGGREIIADHGGTAPLPIPDMDDPIVLKAHLDFIKRLGERYDGHPDIDHLDLGSIGWWGEWHLSGTKKAQLPTLDNRMKVVDAYLAAFKKTPLIMLLNGLECTTYATQHGAGWRCDSLGDLGSFSSTWNHMKNGYPQWIRATMVQDVWKTAPIAYEPPAAVSEFVEKKWPLRWIFNYGLACHGSYFNGKSGKLPTDDHFRQEMERFLRRLGYRLVLKELKYPPRVMVGGKLELSMKWQNVGSAPCYKPYRIAYRFSTANGYSKVIVGKTTVDHWLPGSIDLFTPDFFKMPNDLPPGEINTVAESILVPADLPAGPYTLSIAIVDASSTPIVRLGIKGRADDGWYPLIKQ